MATNRLEALLTITNYFGVHVASMQILPEKEVIVMAQQLKLSLPVPEGYVIKFVAWITLKNGKRLYAKACGKRAFPLIVKAT